jgi:hypothetical protein
MLHQTQGGKGLLWAGVMQAQGCTAFHGLSAGHQVCVVASATPVQSVVAVHPPILVVVVPTGQARQGGVGTVVLPPNDTKPTGHRKQLERSSAVLPKPRLQTVGRSGENRK